MTQPKKSNRLYHLTERQSDAYGRGAGHDNAFTVLAGSYADANPTEEFVTDQRCATWRRRQQLIANNTLIPDERDMLSLRLVDDVTFDSPSMAASVMTGRSERGTVVWREL